MMPVRHLVSFLDRPLPMAMARIDVVHVCVARAYRCGRNDRQAVIAAAHREAAQGAASVAM